VAHIPQVLKEPQCAMAHIPQVLKEPARPVMALARAVRGTPSNAVIGISEFFCACSVVGVGHVMQMIDPTMKRQSESEFF
jgi:hypothetical protein